MREPRDLSHHNLQRIVESIQAFLYIDRDEDGRQIWDPGKEWNLSDACDYVACVLSQHDLVPEERQLLACEEHQYFLGTIDGPTFRRQRQLLLSLARDGKARSSDRELLDGLVNLTDAIADQAHDKHGVDCLLNEVPPS